MTKDLGVVMRCAHVQVRCLRVCLAVMLLPDAPLTAQPLPVVTPRAGLVITSSVRVKPGIYRLRAPAAPDSALITIRGRNITVDMRGVVLVGTPLDSAPDAARGTAVRIEGGEQVRVHGLVARGYKVGLLARDVRNLVLERNDLSHGWKPRLFSVMEHESLNDWLSYHKNEKDEWLRFGGGLYLRGVRGGRIVGNIVQQAMNGLLLSHSDSLDIRDNDFSYNSGLGIGMYRASWHRVVNNRVDFNVRGSSHGFYQRGQDSAALLMFEQCMHNVIAYNSMTHSGDGLFLWAGQHTMDTGQGGSNDNLFLMNDFSFAPTNGMEATFSRNQFIGNRIAGSTHGLWGGYSYESRVVGNCFTDNRIAIAIEHGQDNLVGGNHFTGDSIGIRLWADSIEPSDWGYPRHRDTRSRNWRIIENRFMAVPEAWRIANTSGVDSARNERVAVRPDSSCDPARIVPTTAWWRTPEIPNAPLRWPASVNASRNRQAIIVSEWGPYDWRSPLLRPLDSTRAVPLRLQVLGPAGTWRLRSQRGVATLSARRGRTGDTIVVQPAAAGRHDWQLELAYQGDAVVMPNGRRVARGVPVRFVYTHWEPIQRWTQKMFVWSDSTSPFDRPEAFAELLRGTPLLTRVTPRLDLFWSRPREPAIPASRVAVEARTDVELPPGSFTVRTLSDDAVRVWVDDRLVIDHFTPHETAPAYAFIPGGRHTLRVQYVQVTGWVELRLDFLRGRVRRSEGSPGPH